MMDGINSMGWWGLGFGGIFIILWWLLIILGIIALAKWLLSLSRGGQVDKDALDLLKQRYASGEIDHDEFKRIHRDIGQQITMTSMKIHRGNWNSARQEDISCVNFLP